MFGDSVSEDRSTAAWISELSCLLTEGSFWAWAGDPLCVWMVDSHSWVERRS